MNKLASSWRITGIIVLCCLFILSAYITRGNLTQISKSDKTFAAIKSYSISTDNFPNPERGFATQYQSNNDTGLISESSLQQLRASNMTLTRRIYVMPAYASGPLPASFLSFVSNDMALARKNGIKYVVRFAYNYTSGGKDAPVATILSHIDQLKPVLQQNYDVIAYLESGFIGAWGEWHSSTNGLTLSTSPYITEAEKQVFAKLLEAVPKERMVALRYPYHNRAIFTNQPIQKSEAFTGSDRSRAAHHDDCFLAGPTNWGTYKDTSMSLQAQRDWLSQDNLYAVQGGETCNSNSEAAPFIPCSYALPELEKLRYSKLNSLFEKNVLNGWTTGGCMPEIQKRLGYRFSLTQSEMTPSVSPGSTFSIQFSIQNSGFASLYNPRKIEIILRNTQTGEEYGAILPDDPRLWGPGGISVVSASIGITSGMPSGTYDTFLNLADNSPSIHTDPAFSIRLANTSVWEARSGYNSFLTQIAVSPSGGTPYSGNLIFQKKGNSSVTPSPSGTATSTSTPQPTTITYGCTNTSFFTVRLSYPYSKSCLHIPSIIYSNENRFSFFVLPQSIVEIPYIKTENLGIKDDLSLNWSVGLTSNADVFIFYRKIPGQVAPAWITRQYQKLTNDDYSQLNQFLLRKNDQGLIGVYDIYRKHPQYAGSGATLQATETFGGASEQSNSAYSMYIVGIKPL